MLKRQLVLPVAFILVSFVADSISFRRFPSHRQYDSLDHDSDDEDSVRNEQNERSTPWRHASELRMHHGRSDHAPSVLSKMRQRKHLTDEGANNHFRHRHPSPEDVDEFSVRHPDAPHRHSSRKYRNTDHSGAHLEFLRSSGVDRSLHFEWSRDFPRVQLSDEDDRLRSIAAEESRTDTNLKSVEDDDLTRPRRIGYSGHSATSRNPSDGISSPLRMHPSTGRATFGDEGGRKKSMLLAARDLEPETERLDEASPDWLELVSQDDMKRVKRTTNIWKEKRDTPDLGDNMSDRFLGSPSLKPQKGSFPHDDLTKHELDEPHSKYAEHFPRARHSHIGGRRDYLHDTYRRDSNRAGESVRFVAGSFDTEKGTKNLDSSQLLKDSNKQTLVSDTKSDGGKSKTIMNVNLLMDQSGGLKIEMNTPNKEKHNKGHSDGLGTVTSNLKHVSLKGPENASPHSVFMEHTSQLGTRNEKSHDGHKTKTQISAGHQSSGFIGEYLNNPSGTSHFHHVPEHSAQFQGTSQTLSHVSAESHQSLLSSLLDARTERENSKTKDSPNLLFGQLDAPKPVASNVKSSELAPVSYSDEKTTVIDFAPIPSMANVDDPLESGCTVQKCSVTCPGHLWKLSPLTGCPTCECCPSVNCKMPCKHGYEADLNGCPTCKCLTEQ